MYLCKRRKNWKKRSVDLVLNNILINLSSHGVQGKKQSSRSEANPLRRVRELILYLNTDLKINKEILKRSDDDEEETILKRGPEPTLFSTSPPPTSHVLSTLQVTLSFFSIHKKGKINEIDTRKNKAKNHSHNPTVQKSKQLVSINLQQHGSSKPPFTQSPTDTPLFFNHPQNTKKKY